MPLPTRSSLYPSLYADIVRRFIDRPLDDFKVTFDKGETLETNRTQAFKLRNRFYGWRRALARERSPDSSSADSLLLTVHYGNGERIDDIRKGKPLPIYDGLIVYVRFAIRERYATDTEAIRNALNERSE